MVENTERHSDPLQLMRARDVAALLGIHPITVWKWAKAGRMPSPVKLSANVTVWRRQEIEAWIADRQHGRA
jgi:predicted DNA-binding transcriptional regulator AlpA